MEIGNCFGKNEVSKVNGGKVESPSRLKDGNEKFELREDEERRIWN